MILAHRHHYHYCYHHHCRYHYLQCHRRYHLYNFGNLPIFVAYGNKRMELTLDDEGNVYKKRMIDLKVVTDERICDGYIYASAFKIWRTYLEHPAVLEQPVEEVKEDID